MTTKRLLALDPSEVTDDLDALLDAEWNEGSLSSHEAELPTFDAQLTASGLDLAGVGSQVPRQVSSVHPRRLVLPVVHNSFFVPGKVPSLNELLEAKGTGGSSLRSIIMRRSPSKGKQRGARFDLYNDIKKDWMRRTTAALPAAFQRVDSAYFGYVIVEETLKRDPSNVCSAAIKFIEDGLVKAKVMPNDGWKNVLGIRMAVIHRPGREAGVFVCMSDARLDEDELVHRYEDHFLSTLVLQHAPQE